VDEHVCWVSVEMENGQVFGCEKGWANRRPKFIHRQVRVTLRADHGFIVPPRYGAGGIVLDCPVRPRDGNRASRPHRLALLPEIARS